MLLIIESKQLTHMYSIVVPYTVSASNACRTKKSKTFRIPVGGETFSNKRASPLMESENDLTRPNDDSIPLEKIDPKCRTPGYYSNAIVLP